MSRTRKVKKDSSSFAHKTTNANKPIEVEREDVMEMLVEDLHDDEYTRYNLDHIDEEADHKCEEDQRMQWLLQEDKSTIGRGSVRIHQVI